MPNATICGGLVSNTKDIQGFCVGWVSSKHHNDAVQGIFPAEKVFMRVLGRVVGVAASFFLLCVAAQGAVAPQRIVSVIGRHSTNKGFDFEYLALSVLAARTIGHGAAAACLPRAFFSELTGRKLPRCWV